jgi:hypothetical protein
VQLVRGTVLGRVPETAYPQEKESVVESYAVTLKGKEVVGPAVAGGAVKVTVGAAGPAGVRV